MISVLLKQDDIANASLTPWKSGEEWGESSSEKKKRLETALSDKELS